MRYCVHHLRATDYGLHTPDLDGGLAQLARAPALHAGGQRFESVILHQGIVSFRKAMPVLLLRGKIKFFDILKENTLDI